MAERNLVDIEIEEILKFTGFLFHDFVHLTEHECTGHMSKHLACSQLPFQVCSNWCGHTAVFANWVGLECGCVPFQISLTADFVSPIQFCY